jgi:N-acetylgalactosamine-6-sulfatase
MPLAGPIPLRESYFFDSRYALAMLNPAALAVFFSLLVCASSIGCGAGSKPNVVFILADDLGWGDLACYGHPHLKTPHLDRLAREGSLWTSFYSASPVCSPSRAAFLTGRFPAQLGIHGALGSAARNEARSGQVNFLSTEEFNLAGALQGAGYATAHIGKWHLGKRGAPLLQDYGFDVVQARSAPENAWPEAQEDPYFRAHSTERMVDAALEFIDGHLGQPFYLNLWTLIPHAPLRPTAEQLQPWLRFGSGELEHAGAMAVYYSTVADLDRQVGRLLAHLDLRGLAERTLVIFSSDNGPEDISLKEAAHSAVGSAGPFRGRKRSLYEGGIRMPFLVRWPGVIEPGRVISRVAAAVDLLPTLCAAADVEVAAGAILDGENLLEVLRGQGQPRQSPLFWEWRFRQFGPMLQRSPQLALRQGEYKLLMNLSGERVELYQLSTDPMEVDNVAVQFPEQVESMKARLIKWQAELPAGEYDVDSGRNTYPWPTPSVSTDDN